ncbi:MAG: AraC family transcriptional regulator [Bacteroidales bacterium]
MADLSLVLGQETSIRAKINCIYFDYGKMVAQFSEPIFLNASIVILVLSGTGTLCVNYKSHEVTTGTLILLSVSHLFNFSRCSNDFQCLCLFVSKEFMEEMDSTDMIYKRIKYGVKLFNTPTVSLTFAETGLLHERILAVDCAIEHTDHLYYKEVILNSLFAFYLDLSNIIDCQADFHSDSQLTRYESMIQSFIELLINYYRQEHRVDFYASELNISTHYLTLIVKRITGQSVSDFIFEMLHSEARTLLTHSKLSIQEIAILLNFSDQSSFGKFFKRKAGISPADYRKKRI